MFYRAQKIHCFGDFTDDGVNTVWNLKFTRGSINIPRNLIAGTLTELEVTRT